MLSHDDGFAQVVLIKSLVYFYDKGNPFMIIIAIKIVNVYDLI